MRRRADSVCFFAVFAVHRLGACVHQAVAGTWVAAHESCPSLTPCAAPLTGSSAEPPTPYDPTTVKAAVRWGTASGEYSQRAEGTPDGSLVYTYSYWASECAGGGSVKNGREGMAGPQRLAAGVGARRGTRWPGCPPADCRPDGIGER